MTLDTRLRWALFCLLIGAYLLVYIPEPDSADGEAVLAVAGAFVRTGAVDMHAAAYTDWLIPPAGRLGSAGEDGATYAKKGLTPSLALLPFAAAAELLPWLSIRAAAMLLNPVVTALTSVLLYTLARRLGFRPRAALITALLYGLATFAIVYTKTLFGEPFAALLLTTILLYIHRLWTDRHPADAAVIGAALGLLVGVNTVYALMLPVIGLAVVMTPARIVGTPKWASKATDAQKRVATNIDHRLRIVLGFGAPLAVVLVALGLYNAARFGSPFSSGYHFGAGEGFSNPILFGLYGLFVSPFRGLFPYSPLLLLALPGWAMLARRSQPPAFPLLVLALVALQGLLFAAWWSWHGGIVWGPRFLLPAVPPLALCLAPVIEAALRRRWLMAVVIALAALSFAVQMLGALYSYYPYIGQLYAEHSVQTLDSVDNQFAPEVYTDPALSAIVGHARRALAGEPLEPAWIAHGVDWLHLLAALAVIGVGLVGLLPLSTKWRWVWGVRLTLIFLALNLVAARHADPRMIAVEAALQPPGAVVAATTAFGSGWLDIKTRAPVISMNAPTTPDDPLAARLWAYALRRDGLLWFVTWFPPGDSVNWQERDLWMRAYFARETTVEGHRALLFDMADTPALDQAGGWRFGDIQLTGYGIAQANGRTRVALAWSADAPPGANYQLFAHLLDAQGAILAQHDRAPGGGYAPPSGWTPGEIVVERLAFLPPDGTTVANLRIGLIDPQTGERLPAFAPDGTPLPDGFALLAIN